MTYSDIYTAIEAAVTAAAPTALIQLPNYFVDVTQTDVFIRVTHLPASATPATLGTAGQNSRPGMTQADVFIKAGNGVSALPDSIVAAFPRGLMFADVDGVVYHLLAYRDGGELVEDGWFVERVVISWKALTSF